MRCDEDDLTCAVLSSHLVNNMWQHEHGDHVVSFPYVKCACLCACDQQVFPVIFSSGTSVEETFCPLFFLRRSLIRKYPYYFISSSSEELHLFLSNMEQSHAPALPVPTSPSSGGPAVVLAPPPTALPPMLSGLLQSSYAVQILPTPTDHFRPTTLGLHIEAPVPSDKLVQMLGDDPAWVLFRVDTKEEQTSARPSGCTAAKERATTPASASIINPKFALLKWTPRKFMAKASRIIDSQMTAFLKLDVLGNALPEQKAEVIFEKQCSFPDQLAGFLTEMEKMQDSCRRHRRSLADTGRFGRG